MIPRTFRRVSGAQELCQSESIPVNLAVYTEKQSYLHKMLN